MGLLIKFSFSEHRKIGAINTFNPRLSPYWENQYQDMFRKWHGDDVAKEDVVKGEEVM